ncbi:MAG: type III pantothenate kinase [Bacteroidetes bacterium]|nr:MAG: type III pantothenate kinase [Bacteroidota bacterium]
MNIALDVGNTQIKAARFDGDALEDFQQVGRGDWSRLQNWLYNHRGGKLLLSRVGALEAEQEQWLEASFELLRLDHRTPLPIENRYATPETLGADRLAAAVGAWARFPRHNCLVVDAGTCLTFEVIQAGGIYLGGNIAPGLDMRLEAMHRLTAGLPRAPKTLPAHPIGHSTLTALQNGALRGALGEVETFIRWCETEFGSVNVLLTGGDAEFFAKNLKTRIFVCPNLVLEGLNQILRYNVEKND